MCYRFYILCAATFPFQHDDFVSIDEIVSLYLFLSCIYIIIINLKKNKDPCKSWVKISKVMPQSQVHSPGKGREALWQKSKNSSSKVWYGLTVHLIRI